jgi:hypothetical protein
VLFSHSFVSYISNFRHSDWPRTQNVNKRADWLTLFVLVRSQASVGSFSSDYEYDYEYKICQAKRMVYMLTPFRTDAKMS